MKSIITLYFFFSFTYFFGQQFPNPVTLSTGQGAVGTLDPLWTVSQWYTSNPPNPMGLTYTPALINNNCAPGAWINPASLAAPLNNGKWITGNDASCADNTSSGYRYFRLTLDLPADCNGNSIAGMNNYILYLTGYVDNEISDVFVNGVSTGISGGNFAVGGQLNMTLTGPWAGGLNYVDIMVYNFPSNGANPYGLFLVADGSAMSNIDSDGDGISDLNDLCVCEPGNLANGCAAVLSGNQVICQGDSTTLTITTSGTVAWNNGTTGPSTIVAPLSTTTYTAVVTTSNGVQNNINATVTVRPVFANTISQVICQGDTATFNGNTYFQAGNYLNSLQTIFGCDSLVTLNLVLNPSYLDTVTTSICDNDSISFQGTTFSDTGIYPFNYNTINGCDSIIVLNLTVNPTFSITENVAICDNYLWPVNNQNYTQSGTYTANFNSVNNCDSIHTLNLQVTQTPTAPVLIANFPKCPGDNLTISSVNENYPIFWTGPNGYTSTNYTNTFPLFPEETGTYSAYFNLNNCISPAASVIAAIEFDKTFDDSEFPNVITPNDDNINDVLNISEYAMTCIAFNLNIFNRWGNLVYSGTETSAPFDGKTSNGLALPAGVYFYKFIVEDKVKSGFIHMVE